jgi:hypothetical protein
MRMMKLTVLHNIKLEHGKGNGCTVFGYETSSTCIERIETLSKQSGTMSGNWKI